eukprot:2227014-Prymnesium_polylepis.1
MARAAVAVAAALGRALSLAWLQWACAHAEVVAHRLAAGSVGGRLRTRLLRMHTRFWALSADVSRRRRAVVHDKAQALQRLSVRRALGRWAEARARTLRRARALAA